MRFVRERKTERVPNGGVAADGSPATQVNILEESVETLILGDGTSEFSINIRRAPNHTGALNDGVEKKTVKTVALPLGSSFPAGAPTFFVNFNGGKDVGSKIFLMFHVQDLGTVTDLRALIEFENTDHPGLWFPSLEGVARTNGATSAYEIAVTALGSYIFVTREEHTQFKLARVRFRSQAGAASAATKIITTWSHAGGIAAVSEQI